MKILNSFLLLFVLQSTLNMPFAVAQQKIHPVIPGDFADPSIIREGNQYFAVGTSSEWAPHFPIFQSTDLMEWKQVGYVFNKAPEWTTGSFWAPEYYYHNGTYYIYYTARRRKDNASFIGVATSRYPDRGFVDHGILIEHGKEAIDAFVFNDAGQLYITFKAYGLDNRPIEILGSKLSPDGLRLVGDLFTLFKDTKNVGLEGQSILKKDNFYYLFYSAGNCCGINCDYNVRIARSGSFFGPYEDYPNNPVLQENDEWKCSGHGTFVQTASGDTDYIYHAYSKQTTVYAGRQALLAHLRWPKKNGWPSFETIVPSGSKPTVDRSENFAGKQPDLSWQWDFRNSTPIVKQEKGKLFISGSISEGNLSGIAYTQRPVSNNFEATTTVVNENTAQKGLVFYGDANASLGLGVSGGQVVFWRVRGNERTVLAKAERTEATPIKLKLVVKPDSDCKAFYMEKNKAWIPLTGDSDSADISFLPQWDRSPRIGLNFRGEADQSAEFSDFNLIYPSLQR